MGVKALWSLLQKLAVPIDLDTLQNEVLAIDISIWLNQAIKGYRDSHGRSLENSHLLGLFHRICKLLFFKIKPVFVFDGGVPYLKRQTIELRNKRKLKSLETSEQTARNALRLYLSKHSKVPLNDTDIEPGISFESTRRILLKDDDIFNLPLIETDETVFEEFQPILRQPQKFDVNLNEFQDLDCIDFESENFKSLPPEIKHELLTHLKEKRKGWTKLKEFPSETNEFSTYQMSRLLHKRQIQENIEKVEVEMQNIAESNACFEWMSDPVSCKSRKVMSDDSTHLIYIDKNRPTEQKSQQTKNEKVQLLNFKKDETLSEDLSEFDYGKSDAIKQDQSSFVKNAATFSSIKASKILHRNLNSDLKHRKASATVFTSQQNTIHSCGSSKKSEIKSGLDKLKSNESGHQKLLTTTASTKEVDVINFASDSNDSFEEVPEISETFYSTSTIKSSTRLEIVYESTSENNEGNSNFSLNDFNKQIRENKDLVTPQEKDEVTKYFDDSCDVSGDSIDKKNIQTINVGEKEEYSDKQATFSTNLKDSKKFSDNSSSESSPQKQSDQILSQIKDSLKRTPSKATRELLQKHLYETEKEVGRLERNANTVSEQMISDCQELLKLFGIPYVSSPMEAEAQCAALENLGLTSGTITDDSDIWLFGGKTVYKNFFTQSKFVEMYKSKDIEEHLKLNRASMISFALLTGSDYTEGVQGVGSVTAVEILSEFNEPGFDALLSFKKWWVEKRKKDKSPGNKTRAKFLKLTLNEGFPNRAVFDAYWTPCVDETPESFQWGIPDLDLLRDFAVRKFGWTLSKVDEMLLPVLKRLNEKQVQKRISDYFKCDLRRNGSIADSKRVTSAINKLGSSSQSVMTMKKLPSSSLKRKVMNNRIRGRKTQKKTMSSKLSTDASSQRTCNRNESTKGQLSESSSSEDE